MNEAEHRQQRNREKQLEPNEDEDIEDIEEENIEIERPSQGINNNCIKLPIDSINFQFNFYSFAYREPRKSR